MYTVEYYSDIKENEYAICMKMNGSGYYNVKQNKPDSERQILRVFFHMWKLDPKWKKGH
jgi:hypothetical protein